jgi:hypothetical protein
MRVETVSGDVSIGLPPGWIEKDKPIEVDQFIYAIQKGSTIYDFALYDSNGID